MGRWCGIIVVLLTTGYELVETQEIGKFWHISDHHLDPYYTQSAEESIEICPSSYGRPITDPGRAGDYNCDSPWDLIKSSVDAMKLINPNPDFIIWTGDDTMHTDDEEKYLGTEMVLDIIGNITSYITEVFPNTTMFPAMGNHDYHPKNQHAPGDSEIVTALAEMWSHWLSDEAYASFQTGGFYKDNIPGSTDQIIMVLNTNYWYNSNKQVSGTGDPAREFQWMKDTLAEAKLQGQKVFIVAHIPPGYFEVKSNFDMLWYYPEYNDMFISIVREYHDVISAMCFGHHHTDTFKIIKTDDGEAISSLLLAPGVTPWATTLPGVVDGANNPGIRLIEYEKNTMALMDYVQYYLDLGEANKNDQDSLESLWVEEYRATKKYGFSDLSTGSLNNLAENMRKYCEPKNSDCPPSFRDYFILNSVSYNFNQCDEDCQKYQICAILEVEKEKYEDCLRDWGSGAPRQTEIPSVLMMSSVMWSIAAALFR